MSLICIDIVRNVSNVTPMFRAWGVGVIIFEPTVNTGNIGSARNDYHRNDFFNDFFNDCILFDFL